MKQIGILITLVAIYLAVQLGSGFETFFDLPAIGFVILVGFGILISSHGIQDVWQFLSSPWRPESDAQQIQAVAESGVTAFVAAGWIGSIIGVVQLLSSLSDPAQIGLGAAVALLTAFYGYVLAYAICFPISRVGSISPLKR